MYTQKILKVQINQNSYKTTKLSGISKLTIKPYIKNVFASNLCYKKIKADPIHDRYLRGRDIYELEKRK